VIVPVVTEYQYPKLVCPGCQKGTRAELRPEHEHEIGERLTATISYLIGSRKMTRRDVAATLQDLMGVDISVGSVQKAWEETADAVAAPYTELEQALPSEPVLNGDETGSRTNGEKRWVWVLCASWLCSTTSPATAAWRCWCSCWGRPSPASSVRTVVRRT
jgi:hypothetical protein